MTGPGSDKQGWERILTEKPTGHFYFTAALSLLSLRKRQSRRPTLPAPASAEDTIHCILSFIYLFYGCLLNPTYPSSSSVFNISYHSTLKAKLLPCSWRFPQTDMTCPRPESTVASNKYRPPENPELETDGPPVHSSSLSSSTRPLRQSCSPTADLHEHLFIRFKTTLKPKW